MRTIIQRVTRARLHVLGNDSGRLHAEIGTGLVALVGIESNDTDDELAWTARKITGLRIFEDGDGKMNRSLADSVASRATEPVSGPPPGILLVPNFTVAGRAHKGRRPDFTSAKHPDEAAPMFDRLVGLVRDLASREGCTVVSGVFGAHMHVDLVNDGPVTIWLDSNE
tara:strand:+ start:325 stop:828 length:504 start_codon:yes stop_codon:yes gene_type:complete